MSNISIETLSSPVAEADCQAISRLIPQVVPGFAGDLAVNLANVVQSPCSRLLVARSGQALVVGLAVLNFLPKTIGIEARLNDLVVDESHREQGYGNALVEMAVLEARKAGAYKLELTCRTGLVAVNALSSAKFGDSLAVNRYTLYIE